VPDWIGFRIDNVDKIVLANNGYLGIGTTDPKQKLSVDGNAYFSGNVGIGKVDPNAKLDVDGGIIAQTQVAGENYEADACATINQVVNLSNCPT